MDVQQQLIDINWRFDQALEQGDAAGAAVHFTDDGICINPDAPLAQGQSALRDLFQTWIDAGITNAHDQNHEIELFGDLAVMTCIFACEYRQDDGSTLPEKGKALQVFKCGENGVWKLHRLCFAIDSS